MDIQMPVMDGMKIKLGHYRKFRPWNRLKPPSASSKDLKSGCSK
jgi:hypothetical protein